MFSFFKKSIVVGLLLGLVAPVQTFAANLKATYDVSDAYDGDYGNGPDANLILN